MTEDPAASRGRIAAPARSRRRAVLFRLSAFVLAVTVALAAAEALARQVFPARSAVWPTAWIAGLGMVTEPGATVRWAGNSNSPPEFDVTSRANSLGFLDAEPPRTLGPGDPVSPRIVLLGDSVVEGAQVPLEERMGRVLETELRDVPGMRVIAR